MDIGYYHGCSQTGTAIEYDLSIRAILKVLDVNPVELDDWNCCGATLIMVQVTSLALPDTFNQLNCVEPHLSQYGLGGRWTFLHFWHMPAISLPCSRNLQNCSIVKGSTGMDVGVGVLIIGLSGKYELTQLRPNHRCYVLIRFGSL